MLNTESATMTRTGLFAVIPVFKLKTGRETPNDRLGSSAAREAIEALQDGDSPVEVDIYVSRGLKASCDYFLRVRAQDLSDAQQWVEKWLGTAAGRASDLMDVMVGVTKPRHYITQEKSPQLDGKLNEAQYQGAQPRFVVVIPVKKCAKWWALSETDRAREVDLHTHRSLDYLSCVKRELYHSTGLDEADFITYFETNDLKAFHELVVSLARIPEYEFQIPSGHAMLLGAIHSVPEAIRALWPQEQQARAGRGLSA